MLSIMRKACVIIAITCLAVIMQEMLHNVSIRTNVTIVKAYVLTVISISIIEAPSQKRLERCETDEPQIQKIRILFDYSITK